MGHHIRNKGFANQFEGDWMIINPDSAMVGRVVTAQYMPSRPDLVDVVKAQGKSENRAQQGGTNSWPIVHIWLIISDDLCGPAVMEKMADGTFAR